LQADIITAGNNIIKYQKQLLAINKKIKENEVKPYVEVVAKMKRYEKELYSANKNYDYAKVSLPCLKSELTRALKNATAEFVVISI